MTALQMRLATHLLTPVTEDLMELTSDMEQRADVADQIDIDFDLTGDDLQDGEDEYMGEENTNAAADPVSYGGPIFPANNDDEMADGSHEHGPDDDETSVRDENIEDALYIGSELDEDTNAGPDAEQPDEQHEKLLATYEGTVGDQNQEQDYHEQENIEQDYPSTSQAQSGLSEGQLANEETERGTAGHDVAQLATRETSEGHRSEMTGEVAINEGVAYQFAQPSDIDSFVASGVKLELASTQVSPVSSDEQVVEHSSSEVTHIREEDHLESPAHLHPIVVDYQGNEMFLFPPVDQSGEHAATFLLTDEQLAYSPIGILLEACRCVLKGSLSEQVDLMINFADLDLHISESTVECENTRLSEVVDIFLRLQENDGLDSPPPLYMDLTTRSKVSHRLSVLRSASIEGTGLSQLDLSHEADVRPQNRTDRDIDPSNYAGLPLSNEASVFEKEPRQVDVSKDIYVSSGGPLPSEDLISETDLSTRETASYHIKHVAHEEKGRPNYLKGGGNSVHGAGFGNDGFSDAATSKESIEPAPPVLAGPELQRMEDTLVDDGDFIDYEDVQEPDGRTSSASSTLQGDPINVHAVQDHTTANAPFIAQDQEDQEDQSPPRTQAGFAEERNTLYEYGDEEDGNDVDVYVQEEQPDAAEIPLQDPDGKGQVNSRKFDEKEKAPEREKDPSITQCIGSNLKANIEDQPEASTQENDDERSLAPEKLHELVDQTEDDLHLIADTSLNSGVEDYASTDLLGAESSGSWRAFHDDKPETMNNLEVENEPEEAARLLTFDDNDNVPHFARTVNSRPSYSLEESVQAQEDDEITYDDEESDIDSPYEAAQANYNVTKTPESFKRARGLHEDDDTVEENYNAAKRVRSQ